MIVLKSLLSFFLLTNFISLTHQKAPVQVQVHCANYSGIPLEGEQIWFKEVKSQKIFKGITDETGNFLIELEGPGEYLIMIKSVGDASNYSKMIIPTLKAGQSYGKYEVTVEIEPAKEFTLDHVYFETGKAQLKKESFIELDELVEMMNYKKSITIEISGHTDDEGAESDNLLLSKNRAESVKKYLVQHGITASRILTRGYGESRPVADNSTEEGRQMNRRTDVRILKE